SGSFAYRTPKNSGPIGNDPFTIWSVSPYSNFSLGPLSTSGSVGYVRLSSRTRGDLDSFTTFSNISYAFPIGTVSLSADQGLSETYTTTQNFGVVKTRGVTAGYSRPVGLTASAYVSVYYRENDSTGLTVGRIANQVYGGTLGLSAQLLYWLRFGAWVTHYEQ